VSDDLPLTFGIDYGSRKISIAGMRGSTVHIIDDVDFGILKPGQQPSVQLLPLLVDVVDRHLANEHPDLIALESPIVGATGNLQTTIKLAMVAGAVMAYLVEQNLPVILVPPGTWKKTAVGNGAASKEEVRTWACATWPHMVFNYDRADAVGLAMHAQHHHREGER
jgi:Holliday junction resolvasome RuvABC endonuclease subunit